MIPSHLIPQESITHLIPQESIKHVIISIQLGSYQLQIKTLRPSTLMVRQTKSIIKVL